MIGQWKEVIRLAFTGPRFARHALDLDALGELTQFQKLTVETAKAVWHAAHPDRKQLPSRFEERVRLYLRKIEEGSAVARLHILIGEPEQKELFEREPSEIEEAVGLICDVAHALETNGTLPERFPRSLLPEYERFGRGLEEDEAIEMTTSGRGPARVTPSSRRRLAALIEPSHEGDVDITGEVLEADVHHGRFQTWVDEKTSITVMFSPEHENQVTGALRDHRTLRVQVVGRGQFSSQGKLLKVERVDQLRLHPVEERPFDATARPIEDVLTELAREVPEADWSRLPPDLTDNLDHHLYGTPE